LEADTVSDTGFPNDFAWGTATSAYQIEGAATEDGKGESIWDRFSHTLGTIVDGSTGDVACDHYHRWQDDLDLMSRLNLNAYRFSVAWSRVVPEGHGQINTAGLDFYDRLVEGLLARGIQPYVTLYHWDLPQALQDRGGWENRDTAYYFGDFAEALGRRMGDRAKHWITLNEPQVVVDMGHVVGSLAPGKRDRGLRGPVAHHLLLAHGIAVQVLRTETPPDSEVGIVLNFSHLEPATDRGRTSRRRACSTACGTGGISIPSIQAPIPRTYWTWSACRPR
jgi:beta-glucosidase